MFFNHYEAAGWVRARGQPIKDWQAAARSWSLREPVFSKTGKSNSEESEEDRRKRDEGIEARTSARRKAHDEQERQRQELVRQAEAIRKAEENSGECR